MKHLYTNSQRIKYLYHYLNVALECVWVSRWYLKAMYVCMCICTHTNKHTHHHTHTHILPAPCERRGSHSDRYELLDCLPQVKNKKKISALAYFHALLHCAKFSTTKKQVLNNNKKQVEKNNFKKQVQKDKSALGYFFKKQSH